MGGWTRDEGEKQTERRGHLPTKEEGDLRRLDVIEKVHEDTNGSEHDGRVVVVQS